MADIDFYKEYNDHYGHQQGDECLRQVAAALGSALKRPGDFLARYGGEEFAIILPGTDQKGAVQVAKNIQEKVEKINLPHSQSTVARYVTVSMGISSIVPRRGSESSTLVGAADQALYEAKNQGRNRIITK